MNETGHPLTAEPIRVLVVEDTGSLRALVCTYLRSHDFEVHEAWSIAGVRRAIKTFRPDIVLLDIGLEDGDGYDIIAESAKANLPVMVISALDTAADRILCLELGADDFLTKPFELRELLLRTRRLSKLVNRSTVKSSQAGRIAFRGFTLDLVERVVYREGGESYRLTPTEFRLLRLFARLRGQVVERRRIGIELFGRTFVDNSRAIDVLVSKLRRKIDPEGGSSLINPVRNVGYTFTGELLSEAAAVDIA